jgi:hypothetical protein
MVDMLHWAKVRIFESPSERKHKDGRQAINYDRHYLRSDGMSLCERSSTLRANTDEDAPAGIVRAMSVTGTFGWPVAKTFSEEEFDQDFEERMKLLSGREIVVE